VLKLWRESCFLLNTDEKETTVDQCTTEAYEAAVSEYCDSYPDGAALITSALKSGPVPVLLPFLEGPKPGPVPEIPKT
jgi:hypothetical protein